MEKNEAGNTVSLLDGEELIPLSAVPDWLKDRTGRKPHVSAVYRWSSQGCGGRFLETVRVGREPFTSIPAVKRFMLSRSPAAAVAVVEVKPGKPVTKTIRDDAAVASLKAAVFKGRRRREATR